MLLLRLGHVLDLFGRFELDPENGGRTEKRKYDFEGYVFSDPHPAHPQFTDNELTSRMGKKVLQVGADSKGQACPMAPIDQIVCQELTG